MRRGFAAAVLLAVSAGVALAQEPSPAALAEVRERFARGLTATVEGRIYIEKTRLDGADQPLVGVGILAVPRSPVLVERLDAAKRESRESMRGFRLAVPAVRDIIAEHETDIWRAGFPDAAVRTATDAGGAFRLTLPAGAWLLFADRGVLVMLHGARPESAPNANALDPLARYSARQFQHFQPIPRVASFEAVSVWLREVDVEPGATVTMELHDRSVWLSGVVEDVGVARRERFTGRGRHR